MTAATDGGNKRPAWPFFAGSAVVAIVLAHQVGKLVSELAPAPSSSVVPSGVPASREHAPEARPVHVLTPAAPPDVYSNIYRYDYVGPDKCGKCHSKNHELWRSHPHSKMTQTATAASVVGDFSGVKLEYGEGSVVFERADGDLVMRVFRRGAFTRQYKVTRTVGSRFVQMYVGVQTVGPEPPDDPVYRDEAKLPFAYWIERKEWFPETYDEPRSLAEYDDAGALSAGYAFYAKQNASWKQVCIKCHNTYAYASRFTAASNKRLVGFAAGDISLVSGFDAGRAAGAEVGSGLPDLEPSELITLGISCESCHFGGREHALNGANISFVPRGPGLELPKATSDVVANARHTPWVINSICRQCHAAEPVGLVYPNGGSSWNSREAVDLANGACASKIACTTCHDPHQAGPVPGGGPDQPRHVAACLGCHETMREPARAAAHSGHPGQAISCLDCHMPRTVHGLSTMIRTHRISSPTDARMFAGEYPNACNVCHLDRPLGWTLEALARMWNRKVDLGASTPSSEPVGERWLNHGEPVVRQVAVDAYARSPLGKAALPRVLSALADPSPPSRMFGVLAVERVLGRKIGVDEYTPWAPPDVRQRQATRLGSSN